MVAGGPDEGGWYETVEPGAGQRTLNARPDVRLLVNHDGLALARTRSGTLLLEEHDRGLFTHAPELDIRNPKVQELQSTMDRGDVDEMSYAFRVTRQEWNADFTERRILEYALDVNGSDVSVVTYPANPAAIGQMRAAVNIDELRAAAVNHGASGMSLAMAKAIATQISVRA
jgi:HK97 family phage prohead protease